jgi:hypothetical protein
MVTLADKGGNVIVQRPRGQSLALWKTAVATIKPGQIVTATGQADPSLIKIAAATDIAYGIAVERADGTAQDPDTAIPTTTPFLVAPCGSGITAWVQALTSRGAIVPGYHLCSTIVGKIKGTVAAKITMNTFTVQLKIILNRNIGRSVEYDADLAATDYVKVLLCT